MNKSAAANERFGASGGVARLTVCADFQAFTPVRTLVPPRLPPSRRDVGGHCKGTKQQETNIRKK